MQAGYSSVVDGSIDKTQRAFCVCVCVFKKKWASPAI